MISLFCLLSFGLIGFIDDFKKIKERFKRSFVTNQNFLSIFSCCSNFNSAIYEFSTGSRIFLYSSIFKDILINFGFWFVFISIFIIVGSSNAVNLTDGLDGLAILPVIIITAALGVIAWASGNTIAAEYLYIPFIDGTGELLVICGAMVGAGIGFLWYNTYPAQIFMGDVGSLSMGAFIALVAIIVRHEIVFAVMSMVFIMEAVSVILQVSSFKLRKKESSKWHQFIITSN